MKGFWPRMKGGNWRRRALRAMGWMHVALLFALGFAAVSRIFLGEEALPGACLRGFLYLVPLVLADLAAQKLPSLWQFLLASLAIGGLSWLLLGTVYAALPVLAVCFFRGKNRLAEEPVESALDAPHLPVALLLLIPFLYSALGGGAVLQKLTLLTAALYLLLCAGYRGLWRIDDYIVLNRGMAGLPVRRIVRTSGLALLGMLALAAALFLPALMTDTGYFRIQPGERQEMVSPLPEWEVSAGAVPEIPPEPAQAGGEPLFQIPPFVTYLFFALLLAAAIAGALYGVLCLVRNFRGSFTDHRDVVQYLGAEEKRDLLPERRRKKLSAWDRSPSAAVRRRYRRAVLRAGKERPESWRAPAEIEEKAGLEQPRLHALYEKARYSAGGCTAEDSRSLKG